MPETLGERIDRLEAKVDSDQEMIDALQRHLELLSDRLFELETRSSPQGQRQRGFRIGTDEALRAANDASPKPFRAP